MSERKEQPDTDRTLSLGAQPARHIVDRGDVVGVEGMPHAKQVGDHANAQAGGAEGVKP